MPVILHPGDYDVWLGEETGEVTLIGLLRQFPAENMTGWPVGTMVNAAKNDSPECIQPVT